MKDHRTIISEIPADPAAPAAARRLVADALEPVHVDAIPKASLVVSELVSNAVIHGIGSDGMLQVEVDVVDDALQIAVNDAGHGFSLPLPERDGPGGFGLDIVERLAEDWGVDAGPPTRVWCRLALV